MRIVFIFLAVELFPTGSDFGERDVGVGEQRVVDVWLLAQLLSEVKVSDVGVGDYGSGRWGPEFCASRCLRVMGGGVLSVFLRLVLRWPPRWIPIMVGRFGGWATGAKPGCVHPSGALTSWPLGD